MQDTLRCLPENTKCSVTYNAIQYNTNFIVNYPMGAFQRQILIVQVIKKKTITKTIKKLFTYKFMTLKFICKQFLNSFSNSFFLLPVLDDVKADTIAMYTSIPLFGERLSDKVHATTPKGIVGGFEFTVFQRNLKEWQERPWTCVCEC